LETILQTQPVPGLHWAWVVSRYNDTYWQDSSMTRRTSMELPSPQRQHLWATL
jgi:hypothetical protein